MGWSLYLVRFKGGEPDPIPLAEASPVLETYGALSGTRGELELLPRSAEEIGSRVTIDLSSYGIQWMTIERPRDTAAFRTFVFDLLTSLQMTAIEPSGGPVLIADNFDVADLPQNYQTHFERIASKDDLLSL